MASPLVVREVAFGFLNRPAAAPPPNSLLCSPGREMAAAAASRALAGADLPYSPPLPCRLPPPVLAAGDVVAVRDGGGPWVVGTVEAVDPRTGKPKVKAWAKGDQRGGRHRLRAWAYLSFSPPTHLFHLAFSPPTY